MKVKIYICVLLLLTLVFGIVILIKQYNTKEIFHKTDNEFKLIQPALINDDYKLNIKEDTNEYFKNNLVELADIIPISTLDILLNKEALFDLKEMYTTLKFQDVIVRRGYLDSEESITQGVDDHKTGYDVDVYINEQAWTDFYGEEATKFIDNAYKYGFVLRNTTKKNYQNFHYRYVGKTHSKLIYDNNITLDTYLAKLATLPTDVMYTIDENVYLYKTSKENVKAPENYKYSMSSIDDNHYIVTFNTNKEVTVKETEVNEELTEKSINQYKIRYDLMLVNNNNELPTNYKPQQLVSITEYASSDNNSKYLFNENALTNLANMLEDTNKIDRHTTYVTSSYRTFKEQNELYENGDASLVQKPNQSEHQTGYAVDLANSFKPHDQFHETAQGYWLSREAATYGFILRYPIDKTEITGINYEPWHFRYVGNIHAKYIEENNLSLEEYIEIFQSNTFYQVNYNDEEYLFYKTKPNNEMISIYNEKVEVYYLANDEYLLIYKIN